MFTFYYRDIQLLLDLCQTLNFDWTTATSSTGHVPFGPLDWFPNVKLIFKLVS